MEQLRSISLDDKELQEILNDCIGDIETCIRCKLISHQHTLLCPWVSDFNLSEEQDLLRQI
jgi:hypothetical protein